MRVAHVYADGTIGSIEVTFADGSRWGIDVPAQPGQLFTKDEAESAVQSLMTTASSLTMWTGYLRRTNPRRDSRAS